MLGVGWNFKHDYFSFDVSEVTATMKESEPTKRNTVGAASRFFDPLGISSPLTVSFKIFAQRLCKDKIGWDVPLTGSFLKEWNDLLLSLMNAKSITVPRCVYSDVYSPIHSANLIGFCDASRKALAAVVYLKLVSEPRNQVSVKFIAAKTRVAPVGGLTIPRLELLSALLLSKLISSVQAALALELQLLDDPICFTDSKVTLFWIRGMEHEWKQFIQNRVNTIRSLVAPHCWGHCPGKENPADIPSRGANLSEIIGNPLWLNGPDWICCSELTPSGLAPVPESTEYQHEMKSERNLVHIFIALEQCKPHVGVVINPEQFSSAYRLFHVTEIVLKFIYSLHCRIGKRDDQSTDTTLFERARWYWIMDCQSRLEDNRHFSSQTRHLDLYKDKFGIWRCGGKMSKSCLSLAAQNPVLLDKGHHLTVLLVRDAHCRVLHNGVKETLAELRSEYWLVKGRQFIRKLIYACTICKRQEGKPCRGNPIMAVFTLLKNRDENSKKVETGKKPMN